MTAFQAELNGCMILNKTNVTKLRIGDVDSSHLPIKPCDERLFEKILGVGSGGFLNHARQKHVE